MVAVPLHTTCSNFCKRSAQPVNAKQVYRSCSQEFLTAQLSLEYSCSTLKVQHVCCPASVLSPGCAGVRDAARPASLAATMVPAAVDAAMRPVVRTAACCGDHAWLSDPPHLLHALSCFLPSRRSCILGKP